MKLLLLPSCLILTYFHSLIAITSQLSPNTISPVDTNTRIGSIKFTAYNSRLSKKIKNELNRVATTIQNSPGSFIAITGYCGATENQQLNKANWDRANEIIKYLTQKKNINTDRFIFRYGEEGGDCNTVEISLFNEPVNEPPPGTLRKNLRYSIT